MVGVIRKRDVLAHPAVTIRCFGWRIFFRTLVAGRDRTFLSLLSEAEIPKDRRVPAPELLDRCIELELRAMRLYGGLARRFFEPQDARMFFVTLAMQEEEHAELLKLCRAAGASAPWEGKHIDHLAEAVPRLEKGMQDAESWLGRDCTLREALRLVVRIESSEVNGVFRDIIAASGSEFVRAMDAFRTAIQRHLSYISEEIAEFDPDLKGECRVLHEEHQAVL